VFHTIGTVLFGVGGDEPVPAKNVYGEAAELDTTCGEAQLSDCPGHCVKTCGVPQPESCIVSCNSNNPQCVCPDGHYFRAATKTCHPDVACELPRGCQVGLAS